jgi:hypothetical protein
LHRNESRSILNAEFEINQIQNKKRLNKMLNEKQKELVAFKTLFAYALLEAIHDEIDSVKDESIREKEERELQEEIDAYEFALEA